MHSKFLLHRAFSMNIVLIFTIIWYIEVNFKSIFLTANFLTMAQYAVVNILRYKNNELQYSDDDSTWQPVTPDSVTGYPKQNEMIVWVAGPGIDRITAIDFEDTEDFEKLPRPKYGGQCWFAKIKPDAVIGDEPKYSITFEVDGENIVVDPKLQVQPGGGG